MHKFKPDYSRTGAAHRYITGDLRLKSIARQFVEDFPDLYGQAYAEARKLLFKHTGTWLNPDQVWWHRFTGAASSPRTYTGWEHIGTPQESMTFVELMIQRFNLHAQSAPDDLQVYGGFYSAGPDAGRFNERNEIRLLPQPILDDFWALDFNALFTARVSRFWAQHSEHFCTLARAGFLAAAGLQLRDGHLTGAQFQTLSRAAVGKLQPVMTYDALNTLVTSTPDITLRPFDIGGYECSQSVRLVTARGEQYLYLPEERHAFHVFASEQALYDWVQKRLRNEKSKSAFMALFLRSGASRQLHEGFFDDHVQQIVSRPWVAGQTLINHNDRTISGDVFVYLRGVARQQMEADAQTLLTSNDSLRKRIWLGYLNAFINVFGSLAPLGWPITLTLVGAGTAAMALNVDQARHARDPRQRKAGVIGAVLDAIFIVFNLSTLVGHLHLGAGKVVNDVVPAAGRMSGVQMLANGETWISLDEMPRRVAFSDDAQAWVIDDMVGPDAERAVHLNADAEWEWQYSTEPSLAGEAETRPSNEVSSSTLLAMHSDFWDTFMQFNLAEEERLSQAGLIRQQGVIDLPELQQTDQVMLDAESNEVHIDAWGNTRRVFRKAGGEYVGGRIHLYSVRDAAFNTYLRSGVSTGAGQVDLIEELADDLQTLGLDNSVTLYRGGSAMRGTSGHFFRSGQIKWGDVLVNTDFTSFSENPYMARVFCSSQAGGNSADFAARGAETTLTFDDTAVVFELPARYYLGAIPIAPFSNEQREVESLLMPGGYFMIDGVQEVTGTGYRFIKVELTQIAQPKRWHRLFELRSGEPFSRERYAQRLGEEGLRLVNRFFPLNPLGLDA